MWVRKAAGILGGHHGAEATGHVGKDGKVLGTERAQRVGKGNGGQGGEVEGGEEGQTEGEEEGQVAGEGCLHNGVGGGGRGARGASARGGGARGGLARGGRARQKRKLAEGSESGDAAAPATGMGPVTTVTAVVGAEKAKTGEERR